MYLTLAWHFLSLAALSLAASAILTIHMDPVGALLIPIAGFLAWVGATTLQHVLKLIGMPTF